MSATVKRVRAIDWMRGLVMVLMTIDHAAARFSAVNMHGDGAFPWVPGTPLPTAPFLTRWLTHLCAPAFVMLAGASLALSTEKRRGQPGQDAFIVKRGLFIAALDPTWMSLTFVGFQFEILQVLYAIGLSLVCMAYLRRLPSRVLLALAFAIQIFGELTVYIPHLPQPFAALLQLTFTGGKLGPFIVAYPFVPWMAMMMAGWVLGRWLVATPTRAHVTRALPLFGIGMALLTAFVVIRWIDGYGNWRLYRDSMAPLQWLHVAKYPPSLAYTTLELGLDFMLLAGFFALDDASPRPALGPLALLGSTAFFYYLLHVPLIDLAMLAGIGKGGVWRAWVATAVVAVALYPLCARYRRYKAAHPDGWTRYI
jgi:uncharacterized membrane protein